MESVAKLEEELKELLERLDESVLEKAMEWGRKVYKRVVEEIDRMLMRGWEKTLAAEHIRPVWYTTCLGTVHEKRRQSTVDYVAGRERKGEFRSSGSCHPPQGGPRIARYLHAKPQFKRSGSVCSSI